MYRATLPGGATVWVTTASDGNFADNEVAKCCALVHQIHGNNVLVVDGGKTGELGDGDALVASSDDVALAVRGADCPIIGLSSSEGVIAAVHGGWRGLLSGVVEKAASTMRELGATGISATVGPFIGAECYEFQQDDLAPLIAHFGANISSTTKEGKISLDLHACVTTAFSRADVFPRSRLGTCTACSREFYSFRLRKDDDRHALIISRSNEFAKMIDRSLS